ncbi:MAG: DNA methylase [Bacteroidia bacterium]|nr:MAG: DNA methylase [Bacteroidia bacterium]
MSSAGEVAGLQPMLTAIPPRTEAEFWTSAQRQASSLHEISYRACFKPQVPRYFINAFTEPDEVVYDPFMGRGTTVLEALLLGRKAIGNDINPLSRILVEPRTRLPDPEHVGERLAAIPVDASARADMDLSMFYHPATEAELVSLRRYLSVRRKSGSEDSIDRWIRMIATNRLTGHSPGFFSVYTLPPNQATTPENQTRINRQRGQTPEYRDVKALILRKTWRMLRAVRPEERAMLEDGNGRTLFLSEDARNTSVIPSASVHLTVTSPPFLNIVNYATDNWLRCWFNEIPTEEISARMMISSSLEKWTDAMQDVFRELWRVTAPGGRVAFEVGEVRKGTVNLDEIVLPLGERAGFVVERIMINKQRFTKTSNIWGVRNNAGGTNTNRIVLFQKGGRG